MNEKMCPRCIEKPTKLESHPTTFALPAHLDPKFAINEGRRVSIKEAIEIQLLFCRECKYLELYAVM
jgi:hypothetical protein